MVKLTRSEVDEVDQNRPDEEIEHGPFPEPPSNFECMASIAVDWNGEGTQLVYSWTKAHERMTRERL